jgi:hypothetical protein
VTNLLRIITTFYVIAVIACDWPVMLTDGKHAVDVREWTYPTPPPAPARARVN